MSEFKPMLAATCEDVTRLQFPLLGSPKLDGIRALVIDGQVMTRNLKLVPNLHVQKLFAREKLNGLDGELIVGAATDKDVYRNTSSGVMSVSGQPDVHFHAFDSFLDPRYYYDRYMSLLKKVSGAKVEVLEHKLIENHDDLMACEGAWLEQGYEGAMLRHLDGPYKHGRSTMREGFLMKLKRFKDDEAVVIETEELMHNGNEERLEGLAQRRSTKKAGLVAGNVLGALVVHNPRTNQTFKIGSGFNADERALLWAKRKQLIGKLVKYKYFPSGSKDLPRFPVFLGFRDKRDL